MNFGSVHGAGAREIRATDLTLDKFIDAEILAAATTLPRPTEQIRSVLVTGVTGFLGRFAGPGMVAADGRRRRNGDLPGPRRRCRRRPDPHRSRPGVRSGSAPTIPGPGRRHHLEIIAADIGEPGWGLDDATWARLAESVDLIVHPAAHVNHVLPYDQLFAANVAGTAELIRLALTTKLKTIHYISTMGVTAVTDHIVGEDCDIRLDVPVVSLSEGYANGYGVSKWASEVLLREAHDLCNLPIAVFRPGHDPGRQPLRRTAERAGHLHPPAVQRHRHRRRTPFVLRRRGWVRLPPSYARRAHYEGLPVDFLAGAIAEVGALGGDAFQTYNTTNPHDDGVSLDTFVDWLTDSGFPVRRIDDYAEWLGRFETAMQALPERARPAIGSDGARRVPPPRGSDRPARRCPPPGSAPRSNPPATRSPASRVNSSPSTSTT